MLRIRFDCPIGDRDPVAYLRDPAFREVLREEHSIELSESVAQPDYVFTDNRSFSPQLLDLPVKLIYYETHDEGGVMTHAWQNNEKIHRVLKVAKYKNSAVVRLRGRRHSAIVLPNWLSDKPQALSRADEEKIRVVVGFANRPHLKLWWDTPPNFADERPITIHASWNFTYQGDRAVELHRETGFKVVRQWQESHRSAALIGCSYADYRALSPSWYKKFMDLSSVVLSPWGWGEYCHRDFECLLSGAVLIKPDTAFSDTWPELIPGEHYIPCNHDFRDFEVAMDLAARPEWSSPEARELRRQHALQASRVQVVAARFAAAIQ